MSFVVSLYRSGAVAPQKTFGPYAEFARADRVRQRLSDLIVDDLDAVIEEHVDGPTPPSRLAGPQRPVEP